MNKAEPNSSYPGIDPDAKAPDSICVLGCGSIGLPLVIAFASRGFKVIGFDVDVHHVAALSEGRTDRRDEGLAKALATLTAGKRISFSVSVPRFSERCAFILTVPTPVGVDGLPISSNLEQAFWTALDAAKDGDLLIIRSTVVIGTTRRLAEAALKQGRQLAMAFCPDRSISGRSLLDQLSIPNVIGAVDRDSADQVAALFAGLGPVSIVSSPEAAEALKLFSNVQRDISFAVANQFALICEYLNLSFSEICQAGSEDYDRFTPVRPGPVGGPCLPKDTFLLAESLGNRELASLPLTARVVNTSMLNHVSRAVAEHLAAPSLTNWVFAVLGLEFKGRPSTGDTRGSFGVALADKLKDEYPTAEIRTFDPTLAGDAEGSSISEVIRGADVVVLANNHPCLSSLDLHQASALLREGGLIYDMCAIPRENVGDLMNAVKFHAFGEASETACGARGIEFDQRRSSGISEIRAR